MNLSISTVILIICAVALSQEPINETCPFTGNPVNPEVTLKVGEETVAFCCSGCKGGFSSWSDEKQKQYVKLQKESKPTTVGKDKYEMGMPYSLDVCAVSGEKLDAKGKAVTKKYDGREFRFCCNGCVKLFEEDKDGYTEKVDALMIKDQLPYYPMTTCFMMDEPLDVNGAVVDFIFDNRLVRLCCNDCKDMFLKNPGKYFKHIEKELIKQQTKNYPLTTCAVANTPLDGMGGADWMIVGSRVVGLCCAGCRPKVERKPMDYFNKIDAKK